MQLPKQVCVTEVVTRDGFQNEDRIVATHDKLRVIEGLVRAGITSIEATSFVHPRIVPQLGDAAELMARLPRYPGVIYSALVPNVKGAQRALAAGVTELHLVLSASETHNWANLNRSVNQSLLQLAEVCAYARSENPEVNLTVTIATAFHCPFEGRTPLERLAWVVEELVKMGINQINLADTDGAAHPFQVWQTLTDLKECFLSVNWSLHLHNTRDMGLANVLAGLQAGVTQFDASLGGIGGCPFAPGATGNISTEDLIHMLHEMGIQTGINLEALLDEGKKLQAILGYEPPSHVLKAGTSGKRHSFEDLKFATARQV
jgi:hydroxymethylglutaryl-CoA lyase